MSDERDSTANNLQTLRAFTEARDALGLAAQAYAEAVAALAAADVQTRPNPAIGQAVIVGTDESGGGVPYYVRDISKGDAYAPDTIYRVDPVVDGLLQLAAQAQLNDDEIIVCGYVGSHSQTAGHVAVAREALRAFE